MPLYVDGQEMKCFVDGQQMSGFVDGVHMFGQNVPTEQFQILIDTRQTDTGINGTSSTFVLPITSFMKSMSVAWDIDWGDGTTQAFNTTNPVTTGIPHTYQSPGEYTITITPQNTNQYAWLQNLGFGTHTTFTEAAYTQANRNKIKRILTPFNAKMVCSQANINAHTIPEYCMYDIFAGCSGFDFTMGENCYFDSSWDSFTTAQQRALYGLFRNCAGVAFTMNDRFCLPLNVVHFDQVAYAATFTDCTGANFTMGAAFQLPQTIQTATGDGFVFGSIFEYCNGAAFTMNEIFQFPVPFNARAIGNAMFSNCVGASFQVNDLCKFPAIATFYDRGIFSCSTSTAVPRQQRSALSIINNVYATVRTYCFSCPDTATGRARWSDWDAIPANWK